MAVARAASNFLNIPLYRYLGGTNACRLPVPLCNILNGGEHADNNLDIQEYMIAPIGLPNFKEAIRATSEVFHSLKRILSEKNYATSVGDEGGFAPNLSTNEEALSLILESIDKAGYKAGTEIAIALDSAASEFYKDGAYKFGGDSLTSEDMVSVYKEWVDKYPIISIEDGLSESDWDGWNILTKELGDKIQIVGDDLFVTNTAIIQKGIDKNISNSVLIKLNQIGTVTETIEAIQMAQNNGWTAVVSHRSGETADTFISHLAVGLNTGQIKTGSLSRSERLEKYNELLRIEEELGDAARFQVI